MTACVSIPTFRRPKSRQKGSAHGTGQSVSPFVQELPSAISFSRLNLVTNNFSSFARGETVRPPLQMSDTKSFTFFLAKDGYWLCPLRCRIFFNVTNAVISNSKGYFQRTTSQATATERRGEDVQVF